MELRSLGASELKVSVIGLGCSNFGGRIGHEAARAVVDKALDLGITFLDTADVYGNRGGSETCLGEILGPRRSKIVLATKFGRPMSDGDKGGTSRRYVMTAVEASLKRLRTDWIDLYQIHWPYPETPIEETLRALDDLKQQGKIRAAGCSNFSAAQFAEGQTAAHDHQAAPFVSCQSEYSLLTREVERDLLPAMRAWNANLIAYLPLASGFLSGKYGRAAPLPEKSRLNIDPARSDAFSRQLASRFLTPANWSKLERLQALASERGRSLVEMSFGWLKARPMVSSIIAGATTPEQVSQNVAAIAAPLSADDVARVTSILDSAP